MIKLALTDLDDSLIRVGLPHATRHALDAIHAMLDAGLRFGPCTGRVPWDLHMLFAEDSVAYRTGVTVNGQLVYLDGELIFDKPIPHEGLQKVANTVFDFPGTALMINDFGNRYSVGISAQEIGQYYAEFGRIGTVRVRIPDDRPIYKANIRVVGDKKRLHEVRRQLMHLVPELDFVYPNPHVNYIDVASKGRSKAKGVEVLVRELGIGLDEVAVFGDAENDLDVLRYVPNSAAMANATPAATEAARWHIGSSADDAVADALFDIVRASNDATMPAYMKDSANTQVTM
jgi:hydroxymethylpyrimidine pyrophosphatase-like HAD family hydrolase